MNARLFFALVVVGVIGFSPGQGRLSQYLRKKLQYDKCKKRVEEWHVRSLEKLNPEFSRLHECLRIAIAREKATQGSVEPGLFKKLREGTHRIEEIRRGRHGIGSLEKG